MGLARLIATLTLLPAMVSSALVTLALSRDGYLPDLLSRIHSRLKTPVPAVLLPGVLIGAALSGDEVFLFNSQFVFQLDNPLTVGGGSIIIAQKECPGA